jgi:hypothetical protein
MKNTEKEITKVENINDANVRLTFTDGSTLQMARKSYESKSWMRGTSKGLILA